MPGEPSLPDGARMAKTHVARMIAKACPLVGQARGSDSGSVSEGFKGVPLTSRPGAMRVRGGQAYEVLDIMDFGVKSSTRLPAPVSSTLVLRRSEVKDNRKRWNRVDVDAKSTPSAGTAALCRVLAVHQPNVALMIGRVGSCQGGRGDVEGGRPICKSLRR